MSLILLGELLAGIIVGPFAIGGLILFDNEPLVELDETVRSIGEISAIVILFVAGLEITPKEFLRGGVASFTVGSIGVIVPFFVEFVVLTTLAHINVHLGIAICICIGYVIVILFY